MASLTEHPRLAPADLFALRALLFVPILKPHYFDRALRSGVRAVILDLEDSIPPDEKDAARNAVMDAVAFFRDTDIACLVRVNARSSADLHACMAADVRCVVLPKVNCASEAADAVGILRNGDGAVMPLLIATVESGLGVLHAPAIAALPQVAALLFGVADFAADTGYAITPAALLHPASAVSLAARAHGKAALGLPGSIGEIGDLDGLRAAAGLARAIGYSGAPVIHPSQLAVVDEAFAPGTDELRQAGEIVAAFDASSGGATLAGGHLIERPVYLRAMATLQGAPRAADRTGERGNRT